MEVVQEEPQQSRRRSARRESNRRRREQQQGSQQQSQRQQQVEEENVQQGNMIQHPQQEQQININIPQNPILQQQVQNLAPQRFLAKIPNIKVLREFLVNTGGYYVPPRQNLTNNFCRKLLAGQKKLLKTKDVKWVENVPNWPEFSSKQLWIKAKSNPNLVIYFPDFSNSRLPQRKYLLNVANTVAANSVIQAVNDIRQKRENEGIDEKPIVVTNEFAQLFTQFISITSDQKRKGLRLWKKEYDQCTLCLQPMIKKSTVANFGCLRHKSHRKCIAKYLSSENGRNSQFLCPQRCSQVWNQ